MNSGWSGSDHFISAQILDAEGNVILFDNQRISTDLTLAPGEYKIILSYDLDKMIEAGDYISSSEFVIDMMEESDEPTTPSDETTVSQEPTTPDDNPQSVIPPTLDKKPQTDQSETKKTTKKANIKTPSKTKVAKVTVAKKSLTVMWKKVKGVSGYQIQYATNRKFRKTRKIATKPIVDRLTKRVSHILYI